MELGSTGNPVDASVGAKEEIDSVGAELGSLGTPFVEDGPVEASVNEMPLLDTAFVGDVELHAEVVCKIIGVSNFH